MKTTRTQSMTRWRGIVGLSFAGTLAVTTALAPRPAEAAPQQEQNTLNFALSGDPDTLDPQTTSGTLTFQTVRSLYDTLVEPDMNGKIVPALAERWDVSSDQLTWTFHLRKGVTFHNGQALSSADVKATIERMRNEATASPKATEFKAISAVETPNPDTVVIHLSANVPILASLASGWGAVLPKGLIDAGHNFATKPVGTGPFAFESWVRDGKIVLKKNPNYWMAGYPRLDGVTFHIIPEKAVQVQGLLSGEIDASDIIDLDDVPTLESDPEVRVEKMLTSLVLVLAMNCSRPPLDDLRARQAIAHAIDKQRALDVAYGGGEIVGTFMDSSNAYYADFTGIYPYDLEKAKQLWRQAGIGQDTVLDLVLPQNYPPHVTAGEIYQEMLSRAGINARIRLVDWPTWISDVYVGGKYDLTVIGHTGKLDPDLRLDDYGTLEAYVLWENQRAADLIARAKTVTDFGERKQIYRDALEIMAREVPQVYVGSSYRYIAMRTNVTGFRMDPIIDTFDFRWTEKR